MYLHDYHYSVSDTANCQYYESKYEECKTGWMHLSQNDTGYETQLEWTMSRQGWYTYGGYFVAHVVRHAGYTDNPPLNASLVVRPTFYINASEELLEGEGTLEKPFIIKE